MIFLTKKDELKFLFNVFKKVNEINYLSANLIYLFSLEILKERYK